MFDVGGIGKKSCASSIAKIGSLAVTVPSIGMTSDWIPSK